MACVAVNSLMRTIELEFLQLHHRPVLQENEVIPPNKELIQSLHGKLRYLIELFDEQRMSGVEAIKHLETRLRDVAFRVEDEIELHVVHLYEEEEEEEEEEEGFCQIVHPAKGKPKGDNDVEINTTCSSPSLKLGHILQQAIEDIDSIEEGLVKVKEEYEHFKDVKAAPLDEVMTMGDSSGQNASHSIGGIDETTTDEKCLSTISLCYNDLPYSYKACFLYLGVFPKKKWIYAKDVARLWAAEGLIKEFEDMSLDAVAKIYIDELRDRNLIFIEKASYNGRKVKTFRMRKLVHAFCVREAQKQKLLHVVRENGSKIFPPKAMGCRWVSIQSADLDMATLYSSATSIKCRSIFCFSEVPSLYLKKFSLLRVFYFSDASMCKKIVDLVHLRYLPPAVRNFRTKLFWAWNLTTLNNMYGDDGRKSSKFPQQLQQDSGSSKLVLKPRHCTIEFFTKNSHLKNVWISGERKDCNDCIGNLVYLPLLQRLCVDGNVRDYKTPDMITINDQIAHLKRLKWLSFRFMNFEWKGINVLHKLPMLKMLRLFSSGIGDDWELSEEDVFSELVVLEICSTHLQNWRASSKNFPKLQLLLLPECSQLREIPYDFTKISKLKAIEFSGCPPSMLRSVIQVTGDHVNKQLVVRMAITIDVDWDMMSEEDSEVEEEEEEEEEEMSPLHTEPDDSSK